jgi:hypothetical protein
MRRKIILALLISTVGSTALAAKDLRFWNLTGVTISELYLAPTGTTSWSSNQCKNDKDGTVDPDERLAIKGITPGRYDVKLTDEHGRTCMVNNVEVKAGGAYAFSISDKQLTHCTK